MSVPAIARFPVDVIFPTLIGTCAETDISSFPPVFVVRPKSIVSVSSSQNIATFGAVPPPLLKSIPISSAGELP